MINGIFEFDTKSFTPLESRDDLSRPEIQRLLGRNHHTGNLYCGCAIELGRDLVLEPRKLSTGFTLARENIDGHHPDCFLCRTTDKSERKYSRSTAIFDLLQSAPPQVFLGFDKVDDEFREPVSFDTFSIYCRRVFSKALADAFLAENPSPDAPQHNPSARDVLRAVDRSVYDFKFSDDSNGYEVARQKQCRLRFGLVFDDFLVGEKGASFNVFWFDPARSAFSLGLVTGHEAAMSEAISSLVIFDNHRAPPYFAMAVQASDGRLTRLYLHQVYVSKTHLVSTASSTENIAGHDIITAGGIVISVVRKEDFTRVLEYYGLKIPDGGIWLYRPDFLAFYRHKGKWILNIREVRGFKKCTFKSYDLNLEAKETYYKNLFPGSTYGEIDGTKSHAKLPLCPVDEWADTQVELELPAKALFG